MKEGTDGWMDAVVTPTLIHSFPWFPSWSPLFLAAPRRRHHPTSHRSSSFTLLQSLAHEDSRDKPTYSVLLGQLFAFIGTTPDQAVSPSPALHSAAARAGRFVIFFLSLFEFIV